MTDITVPVPQTRRNVWLGALFAFVATFAFSAKAVLVKLAYVHAVDPLTLLTLRMLFSLPFFVIPAVWSMRGTAVVPLEKRDWISLAVLGFLGFYLASLLDFMGLEYITASLERLIVFLYPTMVVLLAALLFRKRITPAAVTALILSYAGILLVFVHDVSLDQQNLLVGSGLVFASTLSYAAYLTGCDPIIARLGAVRFTAYAMTISGIIVVTHFLLTHPAGELATQPVPIYRLAIIMALFSTVLPAFMLSAGIRRIGAGKASIIGAAGPVCTIGLAYLLLGETMTKDQIAGAALVLAGVLWIIIRK
jgi:drug/metabolite transporter (DMT)-like permease